MFQRQKIGNVTVAFSDEQAAFIMTAIRKKTELYRVNGLIPVDIKLVSVDDEYHVDDYYVNASILLPDAKAMECLLNDDIQGFEYFYTMHLNSPDVREYLLVLVAGLMTKAIDYIICFGNDCVNMPAIPNFLLGFLQQNIGLNLIPYEQVWMDWTKVLEPGIMPGYMSSNFAALQANGYVETTTGLFQHFC